MKKLTAIMLVVMMTLGLGVAATADSSPSEVVNPANPNYDVPTRIDTETTDDGSVVEYKISGDNSTATVVDAQNPNGNMVKIGSAHDQDNNEVTSIIIGDGSHGILDSKEGRKIITLQTNDTGKKVIFKANAMKGSKINKIIVKNSKAKFEKNVFKSTKQRKVRIHLKNIRKAKDLSVAKGAFKNLKSSSKIYLSKKLSKKEYKKIVNKLRKAGYTGKIVRN